MGSKKRDILGEGRGWKEDDEQHVSFYGRIRLNSVHAHTRTFTANKKQKMGRFEVEGEGGGLINAVFVEFFEQPPLTQMMLPQGGTRAVYNKKGTLEGNS